MFPGQGSQYPGMASDLYQQYAKVRALFDEADGILGFELSECCFAQDTATDRAEWVLTQTDICQPAIYLHSLAVFKALGRPPVAVAGHSVGEYSALAASGAIAFSDGLRLVRLRAQLMGQAGEQRRGAMSAILGMDAAALVATCKEASTDDEVVQPANFNAPGQVVISGDAAAVTYASALARQRGARRVIPLRVSGAFHSPLMQDVYGPLALHVADLEIGIPDCPVYMNALGTATTDPAQIRQNLLQQLTSPVLWMQLIRAMDRDGCTRYVELGPGRVLSGLTRRILGRGTDVRSVGFAHEVADAINLMSS